METCLYCDEPGSESNPLVQCGDRFAHVDCLTEMGAAEDHDPFEPPEPESPLPPPLPWPSDLSCHPCVRGEHEKCVGYVLVADNIRDPDATTIKRQCAHGGPWCRRAPAAAPQGAAAAPEESQAPRSAPPPPAAVVWPEEPPPPPAAHEPAAPGGAKASAPAPAAYRPRMRQINLFPGIK